MIKNNGFTVGGTLTDNNGVVWEIAATETFGHFVLMKPEKKKPAPTIIPVTTIKGKDYVLLEDARRLAGQLVADDGADDD